MMVRIIARLLGRVILLALSGMVVGAFIGVIDGALFGVILGVIISVPGLIAPYPGTGVFDTIVVAGIFGAYIGFGVGAVIAGLALATVAVLRPPHSDLKNVAFQQAVNSAFWAALLSAGAGAISGTILHWMYLALWEKHPKWTGSLISDTLEPGGGFFWGSIVGFAVGLFIGAIIGGLGKWPKLSIRDLLRPPFTMNQSSRPASK